MTRASAAIVLTSLLSIASCGAPRADQRESLVKFEVELLEQAQRIEGGPVAIREIYKDPQVSVNLVRLTGPIALHRHFKSEECVYLISGAGRFEMPGAIRELKAGDFCAVPPNTPHGFTPTGDGPVIVLSIFTPPFEAGDRVFEMTEEPPISERR